MMLASFFLPLRTLHATAPLPLLLLFVVIIINGGVIVVVDARRGALVRDGMNSKSAWDNPLGRGSSTDVTIDPDVIALTSKCSKWMLDPICLDNTAAVAVEKENTTLDDDYEATVVREMLGKLTTQPIHITFRSKTLANARRSNWLRTTASLGGGGGTTTATEKKFSRGLPLRAVWTIGSTTATRPPSSTAAAVSSANVLNDNYETCLGRLYGKCVEIEVLLPKTKTIINNSGDSDSTTNFIRRLVGRKTIKEAASGVSSSRPPPSVVYRVPIQSGHVNPLGMTSKCRALVTFYPRGRTVVSSSSSSSASGSSNNSNDDNDVGINLGLTNIHLPLGPGLVDPSWSKGRKIFWKGRSVGLV
jgi:hypothetical protein